MPPPRLPPAGPPTDASLARVRDEVIFAGRCNHSVSWGAYLGWALVSALGIAGAWGLSTLPALAGWPVWVLGLVGLPGLGWVYLRHLTTSYKISRRRVEFERGVLTKEIDSLELWRVVDVRYRQTLLDRILGNATITLIGTDKTDPQLRIHGVPHHRRVFEALRDAVQEARHGGRPMELVGGELTDVLPPV